MLDLTGEERGSNHPNFKGPRIRSHRQTIQPFIPLLFPAGWKDHPILQKAILG